MSFLRRKSILTLRTRLVMLSFCVVPMACSTTSNVPANVAVTKAMVTEDFVLEQALAETSGLYCHGDGQAYTLNDSGNDAEIFEIDAGGAIKRTISLPIRNRDWEALAGDETHWYIGDFGNNAGQREQVTIYKVDQQNPSEEVQALKLTYANFNKRANSLYAHDFDAEALVAMDDKLVMFSKSWLTQTLNIYHIDKATREQTLAPETALKGLPGMVTGADWDAKHQRFVLVGYGAHTFGISDPFIAVLSADYHLQSVKMLRGYGQVEALCVDSSGEVWVTQESSPFGQAKLIKVALENEAGAVTNTVLAEDK